MQSSSVFPPPPGLLGADSLGLADPLPPEGFDPCTAPPVENWLGSCGESGVMGGSGCAGALMAGGGVAVPCGLVAVLAPAPEGDVVVGALTAGAALPEVPL